MFVFQGLKHRRTTVCVYHAGKKSSEMRENLLSRHLLFHMKRDVASVDCWTFFGLFQRLHN